MKYYSFNALKCLKSFEPKRIFELENFLNNKLPSYYRLFIENFYIGKDSLDKAYYWDEKECFLFPSIGYSYERDNIYVSIEDFCSIDEILNYEISEYLGQKLLRIAYSNDGAGTDIYLGVDENNKDKIFKASWDFWDSETHLIEISNNIFDFIKGIKSSKLEGSPQLYRNWGEDFWRVREEES